MSRDFHVAVRQDDRDLSHRPVPVRGVRRGNCGQVRTRNIRAVTDVQFRMTYMPATLPSIGSGPAPSQPQTTTSGNKQQQNQQDGSSRHG